MKNTIFLIAILLVFLSPHSSLAQNSDLTIYTFNVNWGDSTLIVSDDGANKKTMLIDSGGNGSADYTPVIDCLTTLNINTLDYTILTHGDSDHYGRFSEIQEAGINLGDCYSYTSGTWDGVHFDPIGVYETTPTPEPTPGPAEFDLGGGVIARCVIANGRITGGGYKAPGDENSRSVGILVTYGGFDFIVAGDLEGYDSGTYTDSETPLADTIYTYEIDVLSVNHHGSAYSTNPYYCYMLQPEVALISVGPSSHSNWGFPTQVCLDHLNDADDIYPDWDGVDHIYVTEPGGGTAGDAPNMTYEYSDIVITYSGGTTYAVEGDESGQVIYDVDEDSGPTPTVTPTPTGPTSTPTITLTSTPTPTGPTPTLTPTDTPTPLAAIFTEIMYDPPHGSSESGGEWVEFYNISGDVMDISGWKLVATNGSTKSLSQLAGHGDITYIGNCELFVICEAGATVSFTNIYSGINPDIPVAETDSTMVLSNSGGTIELLDADDDLVVSVVYGGVPADQPIVYDYDSDSWNGDVIDYGYGAGFGNPGETNNNQTLPPCDSSTPTSTATWAPSTPTYTPTPLPVVPLALIKSDYGDYNLYCYEVPAVGDCTYWDAAARNPSALARDLWMIPAGNNAISMSEVSVDGMGEQALAVLKRDGGLDQNLFLYNAPVPGDRTFRDALARNPSPLARDLWVIPSGNGISLMADAEDYLTVMKSERRGDYNLYLYNAPAISDWTYWDAATRNPSPVARDLWIIPQGNDAVAMCGLDTTGDGDSDNLLVVRNEGGDYNVYLWNMPAKGDWTYLDAIARNPLERAIDLWMIPQRNDIVLVTGINRGTSFDELVVMENYAGDYNLYIWNAPRPGDFTWKDAFSRNPSPLARDLWMIPAGNNTIGISAIRVE